MDMKRVGLALTIATAFAAFAVNQGSAASFTVGTAPVGLAVTVDGTNYTAPVTFDWAADSMHTLDTPSPQVAGDGHSRASFANWSDGGAQSHSITVPASDTTHHGELLSPSTCWTRPSPRRKRARSQTIPSVPGTMPGSWSH